LEKILFIYLNSLIAGIILISFLFLRKTPYGIPYVIDVFHYFPHAVFYYCYGMTLTSIPFFVFVLLKKNRNSDFIIYLYASVLFVTLAVTQFDNEIQRFLGMHLSLDFIAIYAKTSGIPDAIWNVLRDDAGGKYSAVILFTIPIVFLVTSVTIQKKISFKINRYAFQSTVFVILISFVFLPFLFRTSLFGTKNRQQKVAPVIILLKDNIFEFFESSPDYSNIDEQVENVRNIWKAANTLEGWNFVNSFKAPFKKQFVGSCPEHGEKPWNFVVISLETFRAWNMSLFNPDEKIEATPFINSLALSDRGAYYTRFISNGQPTIFSFMTIHTGLLPHSRKTVAKAFTQKELESFSSILRQNGYHTAFFGGSDPDWDNQRHWLKKWYDHIHYDPSDNEKDRVVMQKAARYLKERIASDTPFVLTAFLISNHVPFDSPEPELNLYEGKDLKRKILNTMHYDDEVLREFFNSIKNESWFDRTVFIITGDHGMDLGERGVSASPENIRHETNWVPLVIYSAHPLLKQGKTDLPASHIDLAPTIMEMAGICPDNSFAGHSLFSSNDLRSAINIKSGNYGMEESGFSIYLPKNDKPLLYLSDDALQKNDASGEFPEKIKEMKAIIHDFSTVTDYFFESGSL